MNNYLSKLKPHYDRTEVKPELKVDNLNKGTIAEMVDIIKKNKEILDELEKKNENFHK